MSEMETIAGEKKKDVYEAEQEKPTHLLYDALDSSQSPLCTSPAKQGKDEQEKLIATYRILADQMTGEKSAMRSTKNGNSTAIDRGVVFDRFHDCVLKWRDPLSRSTFSATQNPLT
jgi:hypothetical protein